MMSFYRFSGFQQRLMNMKKKQEDRPTKPCHGCIGSGRIRAWQPSLGLEAEEMCCLCGGTGRLEVVVRA